MIMTPAGLAHKAWVAHYKAKGPFLTQYGAFIKGFNEGAALAMEKHLDEALGPKPEATVPAVPTVDAVRQHFCEMDRASRMSWFMDAVTKFARRV
jgi:hypothetical protein